MSYFSQLGLAVYYGTDPSRYKKHPSETNMVIKDGCRIWETKTRYVLRVEETDDINELLSLFDVPYAVAQQWLAQEGRYRTAVITTHEQSEETSVASAQSAKTEKVSCALSKRRPNTADAIRKEMRHVTPQTQDQSTQKLPWRAGAIGSACPLFNDRVTAYIVKHHAPRTKTPGGAAMQTKTKTRNPKPTPKETTWSSLPPRLAGSIRTIRPRFVEAQAGAGRGQP